MRFVIEIRPYVFSFIHCYFALW